MVLLAVPWAAVPKALSGLPAWEGRILIDATNQFVTKGSQLAVADLGGRGSSEMVVELAPGASVVKAINSVFIKNFAAGPRLGEVRRVIFLSGDDESAKCEVGTLITSLGFAVIDLGDLQTGGRIIERSVAGSRIHVLKVWRGPPLLERKASGGLPTVGIESRKRNTASSEIE